MEYNDCNLTGYLDWYHNVRSWTQKQYTLGQLDCYFRLFKDVSGTN